MNLISTIKDWYQRLVKRVETFIDKGDIINGVEFVKPDDDIKDQNYWD